MFYERGFGQDYRRGHRGKLADVTHILINGFHFVGYGGFFYLPYYPDVNIRGGSFSYVDVISNTISSPLLITLYFMYIALFPPFQFHLEDRSSFSIIVSRSPFVGLIVN